MGTVAIHVIWTTYMTWPPGDERGHWSPLFDLYRGLKEQGHKLNVADPATLRIATELAKEPQRILTSIDQQIIAETIGAIVREMGIDVLAAAIERTHTHLLPGAPSTTSTSLSGRSKVERVPK